MVMPPEVEPTGAKTANIVALVRALIMRREPFAAIGAYFAAFVFYCFWVLSAHDLFEGNLPLAAPFAMLIVLQVFYPTVLGWLLIATPFWTYTVLGAGLAIFSTWRTPSAEELIFYAIFEGGLCFVSVLLYRARPWKNSFA